MLMRLSRDNLSALDIAMKLGRTKESVHAQARQWAVNKFGDSKRAARLGEFPLATIFRWAGTDVS